MPHRQNRSIYRLVSTQIRAEGALFQFQLQLRILCMSPHSRARVDSLLCRFVGIFAPQILRVGWMGCFGRTGYVQDGISPAKRIGHGFFGKRVGHPLAINYQTVFVSAWGQRGFLNPMTASRRMHGFDGGLPVVETSRDEHRFGCRMSEFKANRNKLRIGEVVVIMIVFHFVFLSCVSYLLVMMGRSNKGDLFLVLDNLRQNFRIAMGSNTPPKKARS
jgi:hypothetical protein